MVKIIVAIMFMVSIGFSSQCERLFNEYGEKTLQRELFVIVDKSTPFPEDIQKNALISVLSIVKPQTAVALFTFSEFSKGKYLDFVDRYFFPSPLKEDVENSMGRSKVKTYNDCFKAYSDGLREKLASDMFANFRKLDGSESSSRSEIYYSLKDIARNAITISPAKEKIVFLLSDMLENSSYTSFYKVKKLADLDLEKELNIIDKNELFPDFDGATVIAIGAGIVENNTYRDGRDRETLRKFWEEYFKKSNANLYRFSEELQYPIMGF